MSTSDQIYPSGLPENSQPDPLKSKPNPQKPHLVVLFNVVFLIVAVLLLIYEGYTKGTDFNIKINIGYISFAVLGVLFYLMKRFRELRDQGTLDWRNYFFDYVYRAFQAVIYTILIDTMIKDPAFVNDGTASSGIFLDNQYIFALFIGMYISKVEDAFVNLGDRFGEMLNGILGSSKEKPDPQVTAAKKNSLTDRLLTVKKAISQPDSITDPAEQKAADEMLSGAFKAIQQERLVKAENMILELEFRYVHLMNSPYLQPAASIDGDHFSPDKHDSSV